MKENINTVSVNSDWYEAKDNDAIPDTPIDAELDYEAMYNDAKKENHSLRCAKAMNHGLHGQCKSWKSLNKKLDKRNEQLKSDNSKIRKENARLRWAISEMTVEQMEMERDEDE